MCTVAFRKAKVSSRMAACSVRVAAAVVSRLPHNPLFSHLQLGDGPLFAYDVERLPSTPHTVVLAACESGRAVVWAGDELLGFGAIFLARGSNQLIASPLPVPDAETAPLMTALHRRLVAGWPVAEALSGAQEEIRRGGDMRSGVAAASFVCIGSGFEPVPLRSTPSLEAGRQRGVSRECATAPST
jgi:CHAT domain-containing protein